jgi:hypothetical protein
MCTIRVRVAVVVALLPLLAALVAAADLPDWDQDRALALAAAARSVQGAGAADSLPAVQGQAAADGAGESWTTIGSLTDPTNAGAQAFSDILAARVEQEGGWLRFVIEVRGAIPSSLPLPEDSITYLWLVDADRNGATGQPHGTLGSEFNVRAVISELYGGGWVDVTGSLPGGGSGTVEIAGSQITIEVGLGQIAAPAEFDWRCSSFETINGVPGSGNGSETAIALAVTLPAPPPPAEVRSLPPLMMLSPAGPTTGQMTAELLDEHGHVLSIDPYHLQYFGPADTSVASVDGNGTVTVHGVPVEFEDTPYMSLAADGVSSVNATVVRSTTTGLGVDHRDYPSDHIAYYLPETIEGVDLDQITASYDVVRATEVAYRLQEVAMGGRPFGGGRQYLVLDVSDDPDTVPCGLSGNPVRLGWEYGEPVHNSCYIVNDPANRVPQFFVIFHELGHNFTWASGAFATLVNASPDVGFVYSEGCASLGAMWSGWGIEACPGVVNAAGTAEVSAQFDSLRTYFLAELATYQAAGANYATIDPNVVDGIYFELLDQFGVESWYDFFSLFAPIGEPLPCSPSGIDQQATLVAAAFSASTGQDLRTLFETDYGFPIDDAAWPTLLACAQQKISARTFDQQAICEAVVALFADGFESGDTAPWSTTVP